MSHKRHVEDVERPATPVETRVAAASPTPFEEHAGLEVPEWLRPILAEMCGIMTMIVMGCGSNIQANLTSTFDTTVYSFGWGVGLMMGLLISIDVSGGHLNPGITISQALFRGFPWKKVPLYAFFQVLGGFLGAVIVQGIFHDRLDVFEGGYGVRTEKTATFFVLVPPSYQSNVTAFFSEIMGAALLILTVAVVTDPAFAQPTWVKALLMMWTMTAVSGNVGINPAFALNPARDLGPRIACAAFGYPSTLWTMRGAYWVWGCIVAPIIAAIGITLVYDLVVRGRVALTVPCLRRGQRGLPS